MQSSTEKMNAKQSYRGSELKYSAAADIVGETTLPLSNPGALIPTAVLANALLAVANGNCISIILVSLIELDEYDGSCTFA